MTVWQRPLLTIGAMAASATLTTASFVYDQGGGVVTMEVPTRGVPFTLFGGARPAGELLKALVFPCPADCRDASQACIETADSAALTCIRGTCTTQIEAAQTACVVRDDACRGAFTTLEECATPCLDERATALTSCHDALTTCLDDCSAAE